MSTYPRVYCFINGQWGTGDVVVIAVAEDGTVLGQHVSSNVGWAKRDIGFLDVPGPGAAKRLAFAEYYPDGYEAEWVDDPRTHAGVQLAFERNQQAAEAPS